MSKVAILSYHKIGAPPAPPKGWESWYYVSGEGFERDLNWLSERGYRFISRDDLFAAIEKGGALPEKAALITFDDGYRNNATVAMPIMRRLGVPGVVFVPTGYIGGINSWDTGHEPEEGICTWEDLHELEENGLAVESHSVSHPAFSDLTDEQHELQLRESKELLEDHLGRAVEFMAYPFGDAGKDAAKSAELLQRVGYRAACLYGGGGVQIPGANRWRLERLAMGPDSKLGEMLGEP